MKTLQKGFTLIELMIVVAIVGILAAIALPAYQEYIARSKISEALGFLDAAKTSLSEYVASNGSMPQTAADAGVGAPLNPKYMAANTILFNTANSTMLIGVQFANINSAVNGSNVGMSGVINADNSLTWTCVTSVASTDYKFLPSNCRSAAGLAWQ